MDTNACIESCNACHRVCLETITACLQQGGEHANPAHLALLQDCAQVCAVSADFMIRGSDLHGRVCALCAEACERCAEACERLGGEQMLGCAAACRRCAQMCRDQDRGCC